MSSKIISSAVMRTKYVVSDLIMSSVAFFIFNIYRYTHFYHLSQHLSIEGYLLSHKIVIEQILLPIFMLGIYWLSGYYNKPFKRSRLKELVTTFFSCLTISLILYFSLLTNDWLFSRTITATTIGVLFLLLFCFVYSGRLLLTIHSINNLRRHVWEFQTLFIGNSEEAHLKAKELTESNSPLGYHILDYVNIPGETPASDFPGISLSDVEKFCEANNVDKIIITTAKPDDETVLNLLGKLFHLDIPIKIAPDTLSFLTSGIHMQDIYADPLIDMTSPRISEASQNIKRVLDVILSLFALIILSPVIGVLAIIIKCTSKGPVFYTQERLGYLQKPFNILKFRTMTTDAEATGPQLSKGKDDPRVTKVGKWMRKYRLDEIPQFWNVLKGDMSIVGPRPEREYFIKQIVAKAPYYTLLQQVKPGITSWGMVKFGYAGNVDEMVSRMRYDLIYLSNMSILVDAKIMVHTIKTIFTGKGL